MKDYLLFDLDGTLTDPKIGITTCVQYALHSFGIEEPNLDLLEPFIGPPLLDSFIKYYHMDEAQAQKAVEKYRERFAETGIFENKLYPGIRPMLRRLQKKGIHMAIASSKPTVFVERILTHFHIRQYFEVVVGSELDGRRTDKAEVVEAALSELFGKNEIQKDRVYMIGDRLFDAVGAKTLGVESVCVTYGYGSLAELKEAHADYIVCSVSELKEFLLRGFEDEPVYEDGGEKFWALFFPFMLFLVVRGIAEYLLVFLLQPNADSQLSTEASRLITTVSFLAGGISVYPKAKEWIVRQERKERLKHLYTTPIQYYIAVFFATIFIGMGITLLFGLTGITAASAQFERVSAMQFAGNFLLGLLCFGVVSPIAEELLFRGILFNTLKSMFPIKWAILFQGLMFGLYHMNFVQGLYGLFMGIFFAYIYEYFGEFKVAVIAHMLLNVLALCISYFSIPGFLTGLVACIVYLAIGGGILWYLMREKKRENKRES